MCVCPLHGVRCDRFHWWMQRFDVHNHNIFTDAVPGGDMWCAAMLLFLQFVFGIFSPSVSTDQDKPSAKTLPKDTVGTSVLQSALLRFHSHTIYDRMLARCLRHVRVTRRGAITYSHLRDIISELPNCEAVILDCTRDFKGCLLPLCWAGLKHHTEPCV